MAKPIIHAKSSARKFGGDSEEYIRIHDQIDEPKQVTASVKFRTIFHSAYGIFLIEKIFGNKFTNSDGRVVAVRDVAEQHVLEDLGYIPSLDEYLSEMKEQPWMAGARKAKLFIMVD
jgi:hypothetical protein